MRVAPLFAAAHRRLCLGGAPSQRNHPAEQADAAGLPPPQATQPSSPSPMPMPAATPRARRTVAMRPYAPAPPDEALPPPRVVLDSNENPCGVPASLVTALAQSCAQHLALPGLHRYPAQDAERQLREALRLRLDVAGAEVLLGSGSTQLIDVLLRAFVDPGAGERLLLLDPSFMAFGNFARQQGIAIDTVAWSPHHGLNLPGLLATVTPQTQMLILINPNNPTGDHVPAAALRAFLAAVPAHVVVVLDQAYVEYVTDEIEPPCAELLDLRENLVILRTLSKAWGLSGLRLGYALARPALAALIRQQLTPYSLTSLSLALGLTAVQHPPYLAEVGARNGAARAQMRAALVDLGFFVVPSQANFLCVDFRRDPAQVERALRRCEISIRPLFEPPGPKGPGFLEAT